MNVVVDVVVSFASSVGRNGGHVVVHILRIRDIGERVHRGDENGG